MNKPVPDLTAINCLLNTITVPSYWSPEQALAVWQFLDEVAGSVWACYQSQILATRPGLDSNDPDQLDLFDPDDPVPF